MDSNYDAAVEALKAARDDHERMTLRERECIDEALIALKHRKWLLEDET